MPEINLVGRTLGRYEILSVLGSGGMAVVYRARQTDLDRTVALKILPPELSLDRSYIARFMQEARSAAALEHPHIVPIYDVGAAEGLHYIAMKYIQGETLKDLALREGAVDATRAATLLEQVAGALDYAHSRGIIHRDIKPSNMMVDQSGWVYLTDFGLARAGAGGGGLTIAGTVMGTPEYMSPEQAQGLANLTPASDVYALGVVLYELLTGSMPFRADTPMGMLVARLQYAPTPPRDHRVDLPIPVEDVMMRALARKPDARFQSAGELIAALKRAVGLGSQPISLPQRPVSPPQGVPQPGRVIVQQPAEHAAPRLQTPPPAVPTVPVAPRTPTPPPQQQGFALPHAAPTEAAPQKREGERGARKPRRGLLIGVGVVVAVVLLTVLFAVAGQQRARAEVDERLRTAQAEFDRPGGIDGAIAAYQRVLELDKDNAEAHTRLALIYMMRGHNDDAEQAAERAIKADEKASFAHAVLAEVRNSQGEYDDALASAEQAVSIDPQLSAGFAARAIVKADRAVKITDQSLLDDALADAEQAIKLAEGRGNLFQAMAHNARGVVYWQQYLLTDDHAMVDRGGDEFNRAIGLQPQIAVFHSNLGYFYNAQGDQAQARGDEQEAQSKFDLARAQFERAQEVDPEYGHAHAGLGWNLHSLKDYDGALGEFEKAIELDPRDSDALIGKSRVYLDRPEPDYDAAIEALEQAAEVAPNDPTVFARTGWAYLDRGFNESDSDAAGESYKESEEQFRKALELNDRMLDALNGLGWALRARAGSEEQDSLYDQAVETLSRSIDIKEDQSDAHFGLGWTYYGLGRYEDAEASFRRAIELDSNSAGNYYWLGLTLEELKRTDEAREVLQTAVEKGSPFAQEELDKLK